MLSRKIAEIQLRCQCIRTHAGTLFLLFHLGEMAAVKIMDAVLDKEEDIKAELNVFQNHSHHPNIVDFHGAFLKKMALADDQLWIVMEVQ